MTDGRIIRAGYRRTRFAIRECRPVGACQRSFQPAYVAE